MNISLIKKFFVLTLFFVALYFTYGFVSDTNIYVAENHVKTDENKSDRPKLPSNNTLDLYDSLNLSKLGLSKQAFDYAIAGYTNLLAARKIINDKVISIVDFSLSSCKKRLFVIDLKNQKLLINTYVSHGRNSGKETASQFSNEDGSFKSSLGFYITKDTYAGKHGYSLRLDGEEKGINDHAYSRGIVMHSAAYVDESVVKAQGYLGRSQGCPAVPENLHKQIIQIIKNGSCFFMYSPDKYYVAHSTLVKPNV